MEKADDLDALKRKCQQHFTDGLAIVVGSGLSVAEGVPGMGPLADYLREHVPKASLEPSDLRIWKKIAAVLDTLGLEEALQKHQPSDPLERTIVSLTGIFIETEEAKVLQRVVTGEQTLRFSRLLRHLMPLPNRTVPVITTNYDRLVEFAAESVGWGVDTMFLGQCMGLLDRESCQLSFAKGIVTPKKGSPALQYRDRIVLSKPHGSLDWYMRGSEPVRSSVSLPLQRLIITPGTGKYKRGYSQPFDVHRDAGNAAIDKAQRLLVLGYGFNDEHLETHLAPSLRKGKPCIILTRSLSENAQKVIGESPNAIAFSASGKGFQVTSQAGRQTFSGDAPLWDLGEFITHILEP